MISDREYQEWIDCKRSPEPAGGFTHRVMSRIRRYDQSRHRPFRKLTAAIRSVSTRWPTKLAVAATVLLIGLLRLVLSVYLSVE